MSSALGRWHMENAEFYIAFAGPAPRFSPFSRFFDRIVSVKAAMAQIPQEYSALQALIRDSAWIDLLDGDAFASATESDSWGLEDVLASVLNGEYQLVSLTFDGHSGRLVYDPWAFPF